MLQLNLVQAIGNLTADPEIRNTRGGTAVGNFRIAINKRYQKDGESKEQTTFVPVTTFGATAENVAKYCQRGSRVYVQGELALDEWEKDGVKRQQIKINAFTVQFMDTRPKDGTAAAPASTPAPSKDDDTSLPF